jgi:undecaprenyl-diphosphatase
MSYLESIILGVIQGIGEPIPVSSSAQTMVASFFLQLETPGILFEVFLNFASFLAILWLTRKDVISIIQGSLRYLVHRDRRYSLDFKMALYVVIGTIPAVIFGFTMKDLIEVYLSNLRFIGIALLITGLFLFLVRNLKGRRGFEQFTWKDALIIGLIQGTIALIPGISRSGSTVVTALLIGVNREASFRYSFLLYLPIGLGTMILGGEELFASPIFKEQFGQYLLMFVVTFVMTMVGYILFKNVLQKGKIVYFSFYCWALGLFLLIYS